MKEKLKKITQSKIFIIILLILLIGLIIGVGTYAWFTWTSTDNTKVTLSVGRLADVTFDKGPDININNLAPVFNYYDGVSTTFSINNRDTSGALLSYIVKLKINNIDEELKNGSFKFVLVDHDTNKIVKEGSFEEAVNNQYLKLTSQSLKNGISNFDFYIYIDGNIENDSNMMNKSFSGTLEVIAEDNTIIPENPSSSDSTFLGSDVERSKVGSIQIVSTENLPTELENIEPVMVGATSKENVRMYLVPTDETKTNYDVYFASKNGTVTITDKNKNIFTYLNNVTRIDLSNADTSRLTSMRGMFSGLSNLEELDLENIDTENVTDMLNLASNATKLKKINLNGINTSNVTNMQYMFFNNSSLETIDLSDLDTSNVTTMFGMFQGCSSLKHLDLSFFDTKKVTSMGRMFSGCSSLISLDLSGWTNDKLSYAGEMFRECSKLTSLNLNNFMTLKLESTNLMFYNCSSLTSLNLSSFDTSNVTNMDGMFSGCSGLTSLNINHFNTSNVKNMNMLFQSCSSLNTLDLSNWDTSNVTNMRFMFQHARNLSLIDMSNSNISNASTNEHMFRELPSNVIIYLKNISDNKNFICNNFSDYAGNTILVNANGDKAPISCS